MDLTQKLHTAVMSYLPDTAVTTPMPQIRDAFQALPEMQRLEKALKGTEYRIVGGAVRDIVRDPTEIPKDIDCQVDLPNKDAILALMQHHYEPSEIKVQPLAVTVGSATDKLDGIDLLVTQPASNPTAAENDVNSLMFDMKGVGTLIDPFGTGLANLRAGRFRIVEPDMEAWYSHQLPNRKNNGKAPRLLKMLNMGLSFADPCQEAAYVTCLKTHLPKDLTDKVIGDKFSAWAMVLGSNIRGDTFDFSTGNIQVGTSPEKIAKYNGCLAALAHLDASLGDMVQKYMTQVTERGACP